MSDEPFGRQPQPVKVTLEGEGIDVDRWAKMLSRYAESHGDSVHFKHGNIFTIYPRAVND